MFASAEIFRWMDFLDPDYRSPTDLADQPHSPLRGLDCNGRFVNKAILNAEFIQPVLAMFFFPKRRRYKTQKAEDCLQI